MTNHDKRAQALAAMLAALAGYVDASGFNVFERNGEVTLGVTYMTGGLVKLGQRFAAALAGQDRFGWLPYLLLWLSFVCGVAVGAAAYPHFGLSGLWAAAIGPAALALVTWNSDSPTSQGRVPIG